MNASGNLFDIVVADASNPCLDLVREFHENVCLGEFTPEEMEDLAVWERALAGTHRYDLTILLVVERGTKMVVGGAVIELYRRSACVLVSYVAIHESMRGKGVAKVLMTRAFEHSRSVCEVNLDRPLNAFFIDVAEVRDCMPSGMSPERDPSPVKEKGFDAAVRQKVWQKMDFVPLNFDLTLPGKMRGKRYLLGLWSTVYSPQTTCKFPTSVLVTFIDELFTSILENEGRSDRDEIETFLEAFAGREFIEMGHQYWV